MSAIESERKKTKYAWAMYFNEINERHEHDLTSYQTRQTQIQTYAEILPLHLLKEMRELLKKDKQVIDCPICLEVIDMDSLQITTCGHKYCKTCLDQLKKMPSAKCALCKKHLKSK